LAITPIKRTKVVQEREALLDLLLQMQLIRAFEDKVYELLALGRITGASHLYAGQEAVAVGTVAALEPQDLITSTHRGHGHSLAHGWARAQSAAERQVHLNRMMAELCGKETGYSRGRGGSMHIADVSRGHLGATGIVGGNIPVATGAALAQNLQGTGGVVACFFGEGATNSGVFHEALNLASIWRLPVAYLCENNQYAMSVPWREAAAVPNVADRAVAYNIPGIVVDGQDVLAVYDAMVEAVARAREGGGPTLIEAKTYRWYGHSRSDPRAYRTREEEARWKERDPIRLFVARLLKEGVADEAELQRLEEEARRAIEEAVTFALEESPDPNPADLYVDVYAPPKTTPEDVERERALRVQVRALARQVESTTEEPAEVSAPTVRRINYAQALNEALREEMDRDERVFIIGEDVGVYGGAYGVTRGLLEAFGQERVRDTPISEATIAGAGVGAAMSGMRPVVEIMYVDFTPLAMDQLANQGAKNRYMFGGKTTVPMVLRTQGGAGRSIAAQHSQSLEALWVHFPGMYVVMPATPYDAKGLLKTAIRDDNLIMFIEHKMLYKTTGPVPDGEYAIPLGVADVKREGRDVTVVTYSHMVLHALAAAEQLAEEGISVEVVDIRTLKPLDMTTILGSVQKTGRVVVAYEGYRTNGFGAELATRIMEEAFDWLDAPVRRVASADVPVPMSPVLERRAIPQVEDVVAAIREVLR